MTGGIQGDASTLRAMAKEFIEEGLELESTLENVQLDSKQSLVANEKMDDAVVFKQKDPKVIKNRRISQEKKIKAQVFAPIAEVKDAASRFSKGNREFKQEALIDLAKSIEGLGEDASPEEILEKVRASYPDITLADEVINFLLETTRGKLRESVERAKTTLNTDYERDIRAGRSAMKPAQDTVDKGTASETILRGEYRSLIGNPDRDIKDYFDELLAKYPNYKDLTNIISFLHHSLGNDLKAEGPSIERPKLLALYKEVRVLQALRQVFQQSKKRMGLVDGLFAQNGIPKPSQFNYESLAKMCISVYSERNLTPTKVLAFATKLGCTDVTSKVIAIEQIYAAAEWISPLVCKDTPATKNALATTLEDLYDTQDTEEEEKAAKNSM